MHEAAIVRSGERRIDFETSEAFEASLLTAIRADRTRSIIIDLSDVEYMSSVGLRALVVAAKESNGGAAAVIAGLQPLVAAVFAISRFDKLFSIFATAEEAATTLRKGQSTLRVHFWGTRGSLPSSVDAVATRAKIRAALRLAGGRALDTEADIDAVLDTMPFWIAGSYGGNTSCVEILTGDDESLICDAGSGLRVFGAAMIARYGTSPRTYHIVMSHMHWDHIMGFPFFAPAYIAGNRITFYGCHAELRDAFQRQHGHPSFPVPWSALEATIDFVTLEPGSQYTIAGAKVTARKQLHGGDSFGYRFERGGKTVVYATDSEHTFTSAAEQRPVIDFFSEADIVIFDAMYSLVETESVKKHWGHSSNVVGVELAAAARAKHLVLYHHEPVHNDATIDRILEETRHFEEITRTGAPMRISAAYDGLELEA